MDLEKRTIKYGLKSKAPLFDPCEKCIVKAVCSQKCVDKMLFDDKNKPNPGIRFSLSRKKRRSK